MNVRVRYYSCEGRVIITGQPFDVRFNRARGADDRSFVTLSVPLYALGAPAIEP